jgi:uncharacterized membrane protein
MDAENTPLTPPATGSNRIYLGKAERAISLAGAALLLTSGVKDIKKHPFTAFIKAVAGGYLLYRGASGHCPIREAIGKRMAEKQPEPLLIQEALTVNRPRTEVYNYWRQLSNLPLFMKHLEEVRVEDEQHSHWKLRLPADAGTVEWQAEIVEDKPGELLTWNSVEGSDIDTAGVIAFSDAPGDRGTEVHATIYYRAPGGNIGKVAAKLFQKAFEIQVRQDLRRFKQMLETGETSTIEGQSAAREHTAMYLNP